MSNNPNPAEAGNAAEAANNEQKYTPEQSAAEIKKLRDEAKKHRLEAQALAAELMQRKQADEQREADWLKEQGNYKALFEKQSGDLERVSAEAKQTAAYRDAFKASLDARIQAIPETMRSLVPEGLDPLQLSAWLDKNAVILTSRKAPNLDAGAAGGTAGGAAEAATPTAEDVTMARNFRMPIADYMKYKAQMDEERKAKPTSLDLELRGK